jgi:hypothetical protein
MDEAPESTVRDKGDSPVIRSEVAIAYRRMGEIQHLLGRRNEAEERYRQAVALREQLLAESPDDPATLDKLAGIFNDMGVFYWGTER